MFKIVHIQEHQRGLWFRRGQFQEVLLPGTSWLVGVGDRVEILDVTKLKFEHALLDLLLTKPQLRDQLTVVELGEMERAIVWKDGRVLQVVGPGKHAYWDLPGVTIRIDVYLLERSIKLAHAQLSAITQHASAGKYMTADVVASYEQALFYRDGELLELAGPGLHVFWKGNGRITVRKLDTRQQTADVAGQEIITADKVTLRVNLVVVYQLTDALLATQATVDPATALYREAQLVLRAAVGGRTLDVLLADKESVGAEVRSALSSRASELGLAVRSVGLKDIILPGDMKTLLNGVIAATKEAEANLIRRREETAAARSQANTAKLLAESPVLLRLKELELLKDVLADTNATFVLGSGELTDQLRTLVTSKTS